MENEITEKIVYIVFEEYGGPILDDDYYADPVAIFHSLEDAKKFVEKYEHGRKGCTKRTFTISKSMIFDNFDDFENNAYYDEVEMQFMCNEPWERTSYPNA